MKNGFKFRRGQIWLWNDPVCGSKYDPKSEPVKWDRTTKYSRQVLIIQNINTVTNGSILVIPFTGHHHNNMYEMRLDIRDDGMSYLLPQSIFPADVNCLVKYIGAVSDDVMNRLENVLATMILGNEPKDLKEFITVPDIRFVGKDTHINTPEPYNQKSINNVSSVIQLTNIKKSNKRKLKKDAKKRRREEERLARIEAQQDIEISMSEYDPVSITNSTPVVPHTIDTNTIPKKGAKWTKENKKKFVEHCMNNGVDSASILYNIKLITAEKYFYKWKNELYS